MTRTEESRSTRALASEDLTEEAEERRGWASSERDEDEEEEAILEGVDVGGEAAERRMWVKVANEVSSTEAWRGSNRNAPFEGVLTFRFSLSELGSGRASPRYVEKSHEL